MRPGADQAPSEQPEPHRSRTRSILGAVVVAAGLAGAALAIDDQRHSFASSLRHIGVWPLVLSFGCGVVGVASTFGVWRQVLHGLGVEVPPGAGARVFFTSQLGKYLPGSVWPVLMQMEAGRAWGASRRTMLTANLVTIFTSICAGLLVACVLLPAYDAAALSRYWWALLAVPVLLALLHPRAIPGLLDRALALLRQPPMGDRLDTRSVLLAFLWSLASWLGLGVQVGVLCLAVGPSTASHFVLSIGAMALAYSVGVLFLPAPAGAGVREVVLALVLGSVLTSGQALAVVLASRALLAVTDVSLALVAAGIPRLMRPRP